MNPGEISNADLMKILLDIHEDVGALKADVKNTSEAIISHTEDDKAVELRVASLEGYRATQTGRASVWAMLSGLAGGGLGAALTWLARGH